MASSARKYVSKISGNSILIFGGSSGIGYCAVLASLEHGASVIISGSGSAKLSAAVEKLKSIYPDLASYACPNASSKLNHVLFCAGNAIKAVPLAEATINCFQAASYVRLPGSVMVGKLAPKYFVPGLESSITFTSGTMSEKAYPGLAANAAHCVAREGLTPALAQELAPVRDNCISPGAVGTASFDTLPAEHRERVIAMLTKQTLAGAIGAPEDLAEAYPYAMKDRFMTGSVVRSDGGRLLV